MTGSSNSSSSVTAQIDCPKITLTYLEKMKILEQNHKFFFQILDLAMDTCMDRSQFKIVRSPYTFGIKSPQVLNVDDVVECSHVAQFEGLQGVPSTLYPEEFFSVRKLHILFHRYPMVMPFHQREDRDTVLSVLQKILIHIVEKLKDILSEISLGTSSTHSSSLTNERRFLGLAAYNSASVEEEPPPLQHRTLDELQVTRILGVFPLTNTLQAQPHHRRSTCLGVDWGYIFKRNNHLPMTDLQGSKPPGTLKGHVTLEHFCHELATRDAFPPPYTFAQARLLVTKPGKDVEECLREGFREHSIRFFPDIKFCDVRKGKRMTWNIKDFIEVHPGNQSPSTTSVATSKVGDI
ncbi:hypothetical protein ABVT39_005560 [Epinephelus coioides]